MTVENTCPHCGKPVPPTALQGICPECMLKAGLADTGDAGPNGTVVARPVRPAPAVEEIAAHFPQLEILECLGRGGMGAVYKARQPKLDRLVALKILTRGHEPGISDTEFAARFQQEARALARLNHPDIVAVYDFGEAGGYHYLLMEYVDGLTLRQLLRTQKLSPEQALQIVPKICGALQFAHERGIVHRDIKPENILLDKQGRVKIADFGIAKIVGPEAGGTALTGAKDVIGTPHYMAPEQVEKPQTVDHRADIYSLGVVFYEMLTGELPLGKFQPPSRVVHVDVRLDEVVLHALEKSPDRRYQHASEVKSDVETIASIPGAATASAGSPVPPVAIKRWRDAWIWNWEWIQLFLIVPLVAGSLAVPFLLPRFGLRALWVFALELGGIAFAISYAIVGRQVRRVRAGVPRTELDVAECLMFRRPFQSPGVAVMHEDRLELKPIVGSMIIVPLADIVGIKEVRWFNGTRLWFKRGFVMDLANGQRVGVAVAEVFARRWRARLSRGRLPEIPPQAEWDGSQAGASGRLQRSLIIVAVACGLGLLAFVIARNVETSSRLAREQRHQAPINGEAMSFGPAMERVLAGEGDGNQRFIDLDAGKTFAASEFVDAKAEPSPEETQAWWHKTGIDAVGDTSAAVRGLVGFEMAVAPVPVEQWESATPARLDHFCLTLVQPGTPATMSGQGNLPATFAFRTREGGRGLLQITGFTDNSRGVQIRYKLVQRADSGAASQPSPAPPAYDAYRAVVLLNEIKASGNEFEATLISQNMAAAQAGTTRLLNLISNFNTVARGMELGFPPAILEDIGKVHQAVTEGDWEKARRLAQERIEAPIETERARAFHRHSERLTEKLMGDVASLNQQGWQLWQSGRPAEAIPKFELAVQYDSQNAAAWNGLGWANFRAGKPTEAIQAFRKVIELEPNHPAALNGLGQVYLSQGKFDEAETYLLKASAKAPAAWYGLARLYLLQGKFAEAEKYAEMLVDSGQADEGARAMLRAAKARKLNDGLRLLLEPQ